jgi:hypothetical protein
VATDTVDAVIVELKKATVFSSRVYRGWPPVTALQPCCGVQESINGELGIDHHLARWTAQIDSWAKSPTDIVAIKAAIKVVAEVYHSSVTHRVLPESGNSHIISTFVVLGGF